MRPYNSLPRGQDINNYPTLALHKSKNEDQEASTKTNVASTKCPPARRAHSEDVYVERQSDTSQTQLVKEIIEKSMESSEVKERRPLPRTNPLMRLSTENKQQESSKTVRSSPRRRLQHSKTESQDAKKTENQSSDMTVKEVMTDKKLSAEKRVSFESSVVDKVQQDVASSPKSKTQSTAERMMKNVKSLSGSEESTTLEDEEVTPVELCDIEPLSGTVFRKVTVRRRRQEMRKLPAVDTGKCCNVILEKGIIESFYRAYANANLKAMTTSVCSAKILYYFVFVK